MKAAVLRGIHDLRLEEIPDSHPAGNQVLVRVRAAGLCGTDVHMWEGTNTEGTFPFVPGHEWSGEVVEVGKGIRSFSPGDRVVAEFPEVKIGSYPRFGETEFRVWISLECVDGARVAAAVGRLLELLPPEDVVRIDRGNEERR